MEDNSQKALIIYCGPSGSGKSTHCKRDLTGILSSADTIYLDRDGLRRIALESADDIRDRMAHSAPEAHDPLSQCRKEITELALQIRLQQDGAWEQRAIATGRRRNPNAPEAKTERLLDTYETVDRHYKQLLTQALSGPARNVVMDWPLERVDEGMALVQQAQKAGRRVIIKAYTVDTAQAFSRALSRKVQDCPTTHECEQKLQAEKEAYGKTRFTSFLKTHSFFPDAFSHYAQSADEAYLWDNNSAHAATELVASAKQGNSLQIHKPQSWDRFVKKQAINTQGASYDIDGIAYNPEPYASSDRYSVKVHVQNLYARDTARSRTVSKI